MSLRNQFEASISKSTVVIDTVDVYSFKRPKVTVHQEHHRSKIYFRLMLHQERALTHEILHHEVLITPANGTRGRSTTCHRYFFYKGNRK